MISPLKTTAAWRRSAGALLLVAGIVVATAEFASANSTWGEATPVEFASGVQNTSPDGRLTSVSCGSAGNCTAVGRFLNADGDYEAFTMTSTDGVWGQATPAVFVAGVQNTSPNAILNSVSCVAVGNCTAVGRFLNADGDYEVFTMTSTAGVWGQATPAVFVAGVKNTLPNEDFYSVSCGSAGNCTAVGAFRNADDRYEAFTMTFRDGVWGQATPAGFAPGEQNARPFATLNSVSCGSAGNCTAVGRFLNVNNHNEAFTMTLTDGVWGNASPAVFAPGVRNTSPDEDSTSVSCVGVGNCTAVGRFRNPDGDYEAFTMTLTDGVWGQATPAVFVAGVQYTNPDVFLNSVSCGSAGNCTAVGSFANADGGYEAFTMTSTAGVWGQATPAGFAPGEQNASPFATFNSVSCGSAGNCTAVGQFRNVNNHNKAFTMIAVDNTPAPSSTVSPSSTVPSSSTTAAPTTTVVPPAESVILGLPVANSPLVGSGSLSAGTDVTATAGGFAAGEFVQLIVASTPRVIASGNANSQGVVTLSGTIPVDLASGSHTLALFAPGSGTGFKQAVTISGVSLPATGSDSSGPLVVALFAVVAGVAMMVRRRRLVD